MNSLQNETKKSVKMNPHDYKLKVLNTTGVTLNAYVIYIFPSFTKEGGHNLRTSGPNNATAESIEESPKDKNSG
jgi:hypothetical protein